ncbi:MAG TPA: ferredoxin--NADP reductase [Roseiarcus sp.]|jgi:ferredoxin--NADP+ reductase
MNVSVRATERLLAQPLTSSVHHVETVRWVRHWTDGYFSFGITRPQSFRFRSGEFVMIGLPIDGKPVMRAYSIASPAWADELEFFSIKAPGGLLTTQLQLIQPGDQILLGKKPTGTLVLDTLRPGRNLFLLGTGTGLAPWLSIVRDPATYEQFERVFVAHGVRMTNDLAYRELLEHGLKADEFLGDFVRGGLTYYPCVTREPFVHQGRLTELIADGGLFRDLGLPRASFDAAEDRVMLCGSMGMIRDVAAMLEAGGFREGSNADPADFVIERAFVG